MLEWVLQRKLARSRRPGYESGRGAKVPREEVDRWVGMVKASGIKSIVCLLGPDQLPLYSALDVPLPEYYMKVGFEVEHIPAGDHQSPPLSKDELEKAWHAFSRLPKPVLVHCSAGVDRTGAAVNHILFRLAAATEVSS